MSKKAILAELKRLYPDAGPELHFTNPYETLVATMLSAQCTDKQVNKVTPEVFARYPDATAMAACTAEELYPLVAPFGVARPAPRVRPMRSRWGSCHYIKGVVVRSSHLLAKPWAAVEYVVLHELCHFVHPDHSQAFYGLLASLMPDWRQRKALLR